MSEQRPEACERCKLWDQFPGAGGAAEPRSLLGLCRLRPPVMPEPVSTDPQKNRGLWPVTEASDWCGEFSLRLP